MDKLCRILVVDDNATNVAILVNSLQKAGYEVLAAEDGFAAVELANSQQPDLILLDMMLPKRDGLAVCRILKSQEVTASIPIIFVTAVSEPDRVLKAFEAGGSDYVTKPFKTSEVLARVSVHARLRQAETTLVQKNQQTEKLANDLAKANVQLARLSRTDPLTELLNRRAWEEAARREHDRFERHGNPYSVLMIDVDHFKSFNDSQGHQAGDDCLRSVTGSITPACRRLDIVGRYGGEEFVVLAPETIAEAALKLAERIRKVIWGLSIPHPASTVGERVTVSIGVATVATGSWEDVLKKADDALYVAKRAGRNMVYADHRYGTATGMPTGPRSTTELTGQSCLVPEKNAAVLVADDDATSRTLFRVALKQEEYRVCEASNGREALAKVAEENPAVVIMDVMMPEIDGLECTRRLRANPDTQDIPIIMISAGSGGCDVLAGLEAGADEYLTKPVRTNELALRVRSMVRLRRERKDLLNSYELRGEQTRILQCLLDFSRSVSAGLELDEILDHTLAATAEVTGSRRISVMLPDPDHRFLTIAKCVGMDEDLASTVRVPIGEMIAGHVFASHRAVVINNEQEAALQQGAFDSHFFTGTPLVSVPLHGNYTIVGVLNVTERYGQRRFEPRDLGYIDLIANITGSAIHGTLSGKARDQARD
ncbi:MAG: response regulator, partial [Phycisphaerales bacterium]